jgi:hypothetical protein
VLALQSCAFLVARRKETGKKENREKEKNIIGRVLQRTWTLHYTIKRKKGKKRKRKKKKEHDKNSSWLRLAAQMDRR